MTTELQARRTASKNSRKYGGHRFVMADPYRGEGQPMEFFSTSEFTLAQEQGCLFVAEYFDGECIEECSRIGEEVY